MHLCMTWKPGEASCAAIPNWLSQGARRAGPIEEGKPVRTVAWSVAQTCVKALCAPHL